MLRLGPGFGATVLAALVCSCSSRGPIPLGTGGSSPASGGSGTASSGGAGSGGSGYSGAWTGQCKVIDGALAYGPIGERRTLLVGMRDVFGFPTPAGYSLAWIATSTAVTPGLTGMNVDANFLGGVPQLLSTETFPGALELSPAPGGFVAATCASAGDIEDMEPGWLRLGSDLELQVPELGSWPSAPAGAWCSEPAVVWTGERFLTSFVDVRGLVVTSLDEQGVLMGEQTISAQADRSIVARFSQNGDRILLAFDGQTGGPSSSVVLDRAGVPLGDVRPFSPEASDATQFAVAPSGKGWLVASNGGTEDQTGLIVSMISREGVVGSVTMPTTSTFASVPYVMPNYLYAKPSAYGGSLLIGQVTLNAMFFQDQTRLTYVFDDAGQPAYSGANDDPYYVPLGLIADPDRDLVLERHLSTDGVAQPITVQEYGCLE